MYAEFYGLRERPFSISPDPRFIYLSPQHHEALAKCQYAVSEKMGLSTIYGDIGAGKTTLSRRLWQLYADDPKYKFATIVHPNFPTPFQLVAEIEREFGFYMPRKSYTSALSDLKSFLTAQYEKGISSVLIVDEAQRLKPPLLETLRQLLNFETNTEKLLQIILFGQNELVTKIDRLPELKDRVTIFGALSSLTKSDMDEMIRFRWTVAGGSEHPFSEDALHMIYRFSQGTPRKVCKLADNALIRAFSNGLHQIDADIISSVAEEIRLTEAAEQPERKRPGRKKKVEESQQEEGKPIESPMVEVFSENNEHAVANHGE